MVLPEYGLNEYGLFDISGGCLADGLEWLADIRQGSGEEELLWLVGVEVCGYGRVGKKGRGTVMCW